MNGIEQLLEAMVRRVVREELAAAQAQPAEQFVTIAVYADAHSIGESTVRAAIRDGRLPSTKIGRAVRISSTAKIAGKTTETSSITDRVFGVMRGGKS